ncbi:winged helix-turn-helix transcriptional regulator [Microbacterium aurum]|uniref:winged helix-turn-helix transcriptional regulator n=1 Tax=Microbacterium aurum TaxID=36805 RepID=UPI0037CC116F
MEQPGLSLADLSAQTGLHANTLRDHVRVLTEEGLIRSEVEHRATRGRPRALFDRDAAEEHRRGGDVVAHERREPRRQGAAQLQCQDHAVRQDRGADDHRHDDDEHRDTGKDAGDHDRRAERVQAEAHGEAGPPGRGGAAQQGVGEVLRPHQDRGGDGAQQGHVDHEPERLGHEAVDRDGDDREDDPAEHDRVREQIPVTP